MMTRPGDDAKRTPPGGVAEVSRVFEGTLASVPAARQFALDHLAWVVSPCRGQLALVVTELVTNAVVHVGGAVRVSLSFDRLAVRVEVGDGGDGRPRVVGSPPEAEGGRGLQIVEALAENWGVDRAGTGKVVWCVVPVAPAATGMGAGAESDLAPR